MDMEGRIREVISRYGFCGVQTECVPFGSGHINGTWRLAFADNGKVKRYILQTVNRQIFKEPEKLMENISGVTGWLRKKILDQGGDPERETLNLVPTADGKLFTVDSDGEYWRVYHYIEDALCLDQVRSPEDFYQSGLGFGNFQRLLSDYPAHTLHETIPDFHNTPERFRQFTAAWEADPCGRAKLVEAEGDFIRQREGFTHTLTDLLGEGKLPLRVTHNDTKLNNLMFDARTGKPLCVIDLDTVMPGLSLYDFGDSIRFGASTAAEDERDLSRVSLSLDLYEVYVKGFIMGCGGSLTETEVEMLPVGAVMMTLENAMRFLTDYLEGDHYFKIHREGHNLDRARAQMKLVADMEEKLPRMQEIAKKYGKG